MFMGVPHTFPDIVLECKVNGLFERFTSMLDLEGNLDRKARAGLPLVLKRYNGMQVLPNRIFTIEGQGHSRKYFVRDPNHPGLF
jgi:hypothetical protein